jgi:hypothetical protein
MRSSRVKMRKIDSRILTQNSPVRETFFGLRRTVAFPKKKRKPAEKFMKLKRIVTIEYDRPKITASGARKIFLSCLPDENRI